jgi:hypothetical protein
MSRRYRERELSDDEVPYGPRAPVGEASHADDRDEVSVT